MFSSRNRSSRDQGSDEVRSAVDILNFASRWIPYGGADSYEIFTTFGLSPVQFARKLRRAADSAEARRRADFSHDDHARVLEQADRLDAMGWPGETTLSDGATANPQGTRPVTAAQVGPEDDRRR